MTASAPDEHQTISVKIARRVDEAEGIISLELVAADGGALPAFEAGSHIEVDVTPDLIRHYSLANDPRETHRYLLGVLLDPKSRGGSAEVHRSFTVGRTIQIKSPRNNFPLLETAERSILLAGGIGITPMMAMAHRLAALQADFTLHYCTRSRRRTAFLAALRQAAFADRVVLHFDDEADAQKLNLPAVLGGPAPGKHVYICGPEGFINFAVTGAKTAGFAAANIHIEYFSTTVDVSGDSFTVRARRSGITCVIPAGKPISTVLIEHGVDVPLSCEQGVCGTCLTNVIEGIPDHRDYYLTDKEKAANQQMTLCCSRSKTPLLVLDI